MPTALCTSGRLPAEVLSWRDVLRIAGAVESASEHPLVDHSVSPAVNPRVKVERSAVYGVCLVRRALLPVVFAIVAVVGLSAMHGLSAHGQGALTTVTESASDVIVPHDLAGAPHDHGDSDHGDEPCTECGGHDMTSVCSVSLAVNASETRAVADGVAVQALTPPPPVQKIWSPDPPVPRSRPVSAST